MTDTLENIRRQPKRERLVRVFPRQARKLADKLSALRSCRPLGAGGVFAARQLIT